MNVRIRYVYGLIVLLFAVLVGFTSYWSVFDAEGLEANNANKRVLLEELKRSNVELGRRSTELEDKALELEVRNREIA